MEKGLRPLSSATAIEGNNLKEKHGADGSQKKRELYMFRTNDQVT